MAGRLRLHLAVAMLAGVPVWAGQVAAPETSVRPVTQTLEDGLILVAKIEGQADLHRNRSIAALRSDEKVPMGATIRTHAASSVVLVFSNGATLAIEPASEVVIEQFEQAPFGRTFRMDQLAVEPSVSRTRLQLRRGQVTGSLKPLNLAGGSGYRVVAGGRDFVADQSTKDFRVAFQTGGSVKSWGLGLDNATSRERQR